MLFDKNVKFSFTSDIQSHQDIQNELNDLKAILLCVALKLDESSRDRLVKELGAVDSPRIKQWISNLDEIGKL